MWVKILILALLLGAGYVSYHPEVIPNEAVQQKVLGIRDEIRKPDSPITQFAGKVWQSMTKVFLDFAKNTKLPKKITGLPEEIVVEDVVKKLTEQVKQLPAKEAHKVKQNFCADIVAESTGQVAGAKDAN